jgi:hypothetical protein
MDLIWVITEEESRNGNVAPICVARIDRFRPITS